MKELIYDYFWKRLKKQYQDLEYLYVVEMQEDINSLHLHILLKDTKHKTLYIPYEDLTRLWNKCHIWVSKINLKETAGLINASNKNEKTAIGRVIKYMTKLQSKFKVPKNKNIYSKSKGIDMIAKEVYSICQKENNQNTALKSLNKQKKEIHRNIENLMKAMESGQNVDLINDRLTANRNELIVVQNKIKIEESNLLNLNKEQIKEFLLQLKRNKNNSIK